jgi:hypothetical protein
MRFKILALALACLFVFGCGTPLAKLTNLYPQESDFLYSQMLTTLQELEWTIESTDRPTLFIRAKKLTSGEAFSALFGGEKGFHMASINFIKQNGETSVSIQISQPSKLIKASGVCKKLANEILSRFEEEVKK